jgi:2'-5' RNA ligase
VLPLRPLAEGLPEHAWRDLNSHLDDFPPFRVELASVEIFPSTNVIFLQVGAGAAELKQMHEALNQGPLKFAEPFQYHPHVTLAQQFPPEEVELKAALARRRWREFPYSHSFVVEKLTFVQNTVENHWADLAGRMLSMRIAS